MPSTPTEDTVIRSVSSEDIPRIVRWWLSSFRTSRYAGVVPNNQYKAVYADCIRQLLERGSTLKVLAYAKSPALILGWICYEHTPRDRILHYLYVRPDYRGVGYARHLLTDCGFNRTDYVYTFRTRESSYLGAGRHLPELARRKDAYKPDENAIEMAN